MITLKSREYFQASDPSTSYYRLLVMSLTLEFTGIGGIEAYFALIQSGCEKSSSARQRKTLKAFFVRPHSEVLDCERHQV